MDIEPPLESDPQLSKPSKPSVRAFDNPAVFAQPLTAFDASSCNPAQDAFGLHLVLAALLVLIFIGGLVVVAKWAAGQ